MFNYEFGMREKVKKVLVIYSPGKENVASIGEPETDNILKKIKDKGEIFLIQSASVLRSVFSFPYSLPPPLYPFLFPALPFYLSPLLLFQKATV